MEKPRCATCFWWTRNAGGEMMGTCSGATPTAVCVELKRVSWQTMWPGTKDSDGCRGHETEAEYIERKGVTSSSSPSGGGSSMSS